MKKAPILLLLAVFLAGGTLFADPAADFSRVVNFSLSLKSLNELIDGGRFDQADKDRYILVDGSIAYRELLSADGEPFLGEIELIQGEWLGPDTVKTYRCIVQFSGDSFAGLIPARRARSRSENELVLNSHALIVGKLRELRSLPVGSVSPVIDGFFVRPIL